MDGAGGVNSCKEEVDGGERGEDSWWKCKEVFKMTGVVPSGLEGNDSVEGCGGIPVWGDRSGAWEEDNCERWGEEGGEKQN